MALTAENNKIVRAIAREARRRYGVHISHDEAVKIKSAFLTGRVESNFTNSSRMTDHDSQGWRQERASLYKNPTDVRASINRYFDEADDMYRKGMKSGDLAANVQRPAAQYRSRYGEHSREGQDLLRKFFPKGGGDVAPQAPAPAEEGGSPTTRQQALLQYMGERGKPGAVLDLAKNLKASFVEAAPQSGKVVAPTSGGGDVVSQLTKRADIIDSRKHPYLWGGGHGAGSAQALKAYHGALDCSGAVSKVLGINPRVSGEFEKWGKPGRGRVTVYANSKHVLISINGRFWGTSASNPGGGAGWIDEKPSKAYLSNFTVRHLAEAGR